MIGLRDPVSLLPRSASLAALKPTTGMSVLITKLEQMTLRELIAMAKLAHTGFSLGCPCSG